MKSEGAFIFFYFLRRNPAIHNPFSRNKLVKSPLYNSFVFFRVKRILSFIIGYAFSFKVDAFDLFAIVTRVTKI